MNLCSFSLNRLNYIVLPIHFGLSSQHCAKYNKVNFLGDQV